MILSALYHRPANTMRRVRFWFTLLAVLGALRTSPAGEVPQLEALGIAPADINIIPEAITIRLQNPKIKLRTHAGRVWPSTLYEGVNLIGYCHQTTNIRPNAAPSFTDIFGVQWYEVTPGGSGPAVLELNDGLLSTLREGLPEGSQLKPGRFYMTALRLISPAPRRNGDGVRYAFDLRVNAGTTLAGSGGEVTLFNRSFVLSFPVFGTYFPAFPGPAGIPPPETVISPANYVFTSDGLDEQLELEEGSGPLRTWIYGRNSTFSFDGWSLTVNGMNNPAKQAAAAAWNRAFSNVSNFLLEASTGVHTLGYHASEADLAGERENWAPFFIDGLTHQEMSEAELFNAVAAAAQPELEWPYTEILHFHAAPSGGFPNEIICIPVSIDDAAVMENRGHAKLKLRMAYPAPPDLRVVVKAAAGTALPVHDYIFPQQEIEVPAGATVWDFPFAVVNDTGAEPDETLKIKIEVVSGVACVADGEASVTILDDDGPAFAGPLIVEEPEDQRTIPGGSATFAVKAEGTGLTYQWFKDNTVLSGRTGATLQLTNVQAAGAGEYAVRVSNGSGQTVSRYARLSLVTPAPEIAVELMPDGGDLTSEDGARFPTRPSGTQSTIQFNVRNTGTASLTGVAATLIDAAPGFSITQAPAATIAAGGSSSVSVRYLPPVAGTRYATLRLASNDADENPFFVFLSATALPVADTIPPVLEVASPADEEISPDSDAAWVVSGTAADNDEIAGISVRVNAGPWLAAEGTTDWSRVIYLIEGANTVEVQAKDWTGNLSPVTTRRITWEPPDESPPVVTVSSPSGSVTVTNPVFTITGTAADDRGIGQVIVFQHGGEEFVIADGTTNWAATFRLEPGVNEIEVIASDTAGNDSPGVLRTVNYQLQPLTVRFVGAQSAAAENVPLHPIGVEIAGEDGEEDLITAVPLTFSGTAVRGVDYVTDAPAVLEFARGEPEVITIIPLNDAIAEGTETVVITLGTPDNLPRGTPFTHTVSLYDDEAPVMPGVRWTWQNPRPQGFPLRSVCWTGTQVVAVGDQGTILVSPDGAGWLRRTCPEAAGLTAVCWTGQRLVAAGAGAAAFTSVDGVTWTRRETGFGRDSSAYVSGLAGHPGRIVAVGSDTNGRALLLSSDNGTAWTQHQITGAPDAWPLRAVAWTGTQFVATGDRGTIATSPDGVTWTPRSLISSATFNHVFWTGSLIIAGDTTGRLFTSPDGITWAQRHALANQFSINGLGRTASHFVALTGSEILLSSTDGLVWQETTATPPDLQGNDGTPLVWTGSRLVAVSGSGTILSTVDGSTWTPHTSAVVQSPVSGMATSGALTLATTEGGVLIASVNGADWSPRPVPPLLSVDYIQFAGGRWFAGATDVQQGLAVSTDGASWTEGTLPQGEWPGRIFWNGSHYVATGGGAGFGDAESLLHSANGTSWTTVYGDGTSWILGLVWSGTQWLATAADFDGGFVLTSPNGTAWTRRDTPQQVELQAVIHTGSRYIAWAESPGGDFPFRVWTSANGTDWMPSALASDQPFLALHWNGSRALLVTEYGRTFTSPDGITWTAGSLGPAFQLFVAGALPILWTGSQYAVPSTDGVFHSMDGLNWIRTLDYRQYEQDPLVWTGSRFISAPGSGAILSSDAAAPDTVPPVVDIAGPAAAVTQSIVSATGTASDAGRLAFVAVRVNGGLWQTATGTATWQATVPLNPGSNLIEAQAWDESGNPSILKSRTVTYTPPPTGFVMDGTADASGYLLVSISGGTKLYAAVRGTRLYVATESSGANNAGAYDTHVLVTNALLPAATTAKYASKAGLMACAAGSPLLGGESTNTSHGWTNAGASAVSAKSSSLSGVLEGSFDLVEAFGALPATVYLSAASHATANGGALLRQAPAGNGNNNLEPAEFLALAVAAPVDSDLNGIYDRLEPGRSFRLTAARISPGVVQLSWPVIPGMRYQPQWSTNLGSWQSLGSVITAASGEDTRTISDTSATGPARFYRMRHVP